MSVFFVNRFYWPETPATGQLLTDVAEALASDGQHVIVITSRSGTRNSPQEEIRRNVRIVRIRTPRCVPSSVVGKALAFAAFWSGGTWRLLQLVRRGDIVITLTDPPLFGVVSWLIGKLKRATTMHWVQDIYPEVAIAVTGHRWLRWCAPIRNAAWRGAAACISLSEEMAGVITEAGVPSSRLFTIPNWAPRGLYAISQNDAEVAALRTEWQLKGKFVVAYSGNLGRVHDLDPVIAAAALLRDTASIVFLLVGAGAQHANLEAEVAQQRLPNVRFFPPQSRERLRLTLGVADVHLVTLRPGCERFVFPSKLYGITAIGRAVLFVGPPDCELARIVSGRELGRVVDRNRPDLLAITIRELAADATVVAKFGLTGTRFGGEEHTSDALTRWRKLIRAVEACETRRAN
jgi:colanic acid biosynthesis glycosyl transferase WcaI